MKTTPAPDASIAPARSLGRTFKSSSRVGSSSARVRAIWASNRSLMSRPGALSGKRFTVAISPSHRSDGFDHTVQLFNGQCSSGLSEKRGDKKVALDIKTAVHTTALRTILERIGARNPQSKCNIFHLQIILNTS